ncbi:Hypothetical predicted protein [Scomber scombrus]|uniref:Uncharacterized protein n=1 Tax=Scomber scombrus TaxID=13677 RepID=A0AAV1PYU8_SCOSC
MIAAIFLELKLTGKFHRVRLRSGSAPPRRRIRSVSILVNVCTSTGCGTAPSWLRNGSSSPEASGGHTQSFYFCRMPAQQFSTEQIVRDRKWSTNTKLKTSGYTER